MERDIVFADEVVNLGLRVVPPGFPGVRLTAVLRPFDAGAEIADHRLKPDIQPFALPTGQRHGNAPVNIARDWATAQPLADEIAAELNHVGSPVSFVLVEVFE